MAKYCNKCGNMMGDNDIFCDQCGTKSVTNSNQSSEDSVLPKQISRRQKTLKAESFLPVLAFVAFIAVIIIFHYLSRNPNNPKVEDISFEIKNIIEDGEDEPGVYIWLQVTNNGETTIDAISTNNSFSFLSESGEEVCVGSSISDQEISYPIRQGDSFYQLVGVSIFDHRDNEALTLEKARDITEVICDTFVYEAGGYYISTRPSGQSRRITSSKIPDKKLKDASSKYNEFNVLKLNVDWSSGRNDKPMTCIYPFEIYNISDRIAVDLTEVSIAILDADGSLLNCVIMNRQELQYDADLKYSHIEPGGVARGQFLTHIPPTHSVNGVTAVLYNYQYDIQPLYEADSVTRVTVSPLKCTVSYEGDEELFN